MAVRELGGQDSSVGTVTRYRLQGPGLYPCGGRDFLYPSRPSTRPTQPPVQSVKLLPPEEEQQEHGLLTTTHI